MLNTKHMMDSTFIAFIKDATIINRTKQQDYLGVTR